MQIENSKPTLPNPKDSFFFLSLKTKHLKQFIFYFYLEKVEKKKKMSVFLG